MRRMLLVFAAAMLMAAMVALTAMPAFALHRVDHLNADDKNNPTFPGTGAGHNPQPSEQALLNALENCAEHVSGEKGGGSTNLPAQCYFGPGNPK